MIEQNRKIAVDSGKYDTKFATNSVQGLIRGKFRTKVSPLRTKINSDNGASHIVEYNGKQYIVGEQASDSSTSFDTSKKLDLHKISTYTAIAGVVDDNSFAKLGIGCPLRVYCNDHDRKEYENFFYPEGGFVTITVDGVEKHFSVVEVKSFAESSGVINLNAMKYMTKTIGVCDIGGLNLNAVVYKGTYPLLETAISEELGGNMLQQSVKEAFQTEFNKPLQDYIMPTILKDGYSGSKNVEKQKEIVTRMKREHAEKIYEECVRKQWSLDFMDIIFCGGSSLYLKNELMEVFGVGADCFVEDAAYSNVLGFLKGL